VKSEALGLLERPLRMIAVDDLLVYGAVLVRPTGIQRVSHKLAEELHDRHGYPFVSVSGDTVRTVSIAPPQGFARLGRLGDAAVRATSVLPKGFQQWLRVAIPRMLRPFMGRAGRVVLATQNDWIIVLGAPWIAHGMVRGILREQSRRGAKVALLIHDLFPITRPEWFTSRNTQYVHDQMRELTQRADLVFTVSLEVQHEIANILKRESVLIEPADPVLSTNHQSKAMMMGSDSTPDQYVLTVGTLHPRKNIVALVRIWERWLSEAKTTLDGVSGVPMLYIVGRRHPEDGALFDVLRRAPLAAQKIRFMHTVSDEELSGLYAQARFVVIPSIAEGWGLPVREALVHGRPVIATDAVPSAKNSPFVRIVPSQNDDLLKEAICQWWLSDVPEKLHVDIQQTFKPRSWREVADELGSALDGYRPISTRRS
jgi:glycosyltransferase involved in cell wall biosynthesis